LPYLHGFRKMDMSLPKDGVFLSQRLRDKIRQGRGMDKLSVEIKPVGPKDGSTACFQVCDTLLSQRPTALPCIPLCGIASTKR
jgi:hypothetical protein